MLLLAPTRAITSTAPAFDAAGETAVQLLALEAALYGAVTSNPDLVTLRNSNIASPEAVEVARRFPTTLNPTLWVDFRPINVRRLLALLRRAALLHGTLYVFEPNDDALRRRIQRGFEELLGLMFRLGAFAGATASEAFRVDVGDPPNSRPSIDAGRLIVELKIAPSLPLRFVTVRLVEHADRSLHLETA